MKTLKSIFVLILFSILFISCTDSVFEDEQASVSEQADISENTKDTGGETSSTVDNEKDG